jgi:transposase InsO family protein
MLVAVPLPRQDADTVARAFVTKVIFKMGTPQKVLTDQGSNFLSEMFKNMCKMLKIKKLKTTPFHLVSNRSLEQSHRIIKKYLRHYINEDQNNWDEWIPYAEHMYNTSTHTATGYTPSDLVYGFKLSVPSALQNNPSIRYQYGDFVAELKSRLQSIHHIARKRLISLKEKSNEYYDRDTKENTMRVGDKVLLYDETVRRGRSRKLSSQWLGPYKIISMDGVNATIKKGRHSQKVHLNWLKPFY